MLFSSFTFLCFFLPAVLIFDRLLPGIRARNVLLMLASVFFYAYGEPVFVLLLLASALQGYGFGLLLEKKKSRVLLALAVLLGLGMLVFYKYTAFLLETLNGAFALNLPIPRISLPIGISFYTFQILSYVIDVYRGETEAQKSFIRLLLYISFFPQLIAGPIVKYHDIDRELAERESSADDLKEGICRFLCGLGKKILIANGMAVMADAVFALPQEELGLLSGWIGALSYFFQIYFDFSGYSDMAIGLGRMFGFHFQENFRYPYTAFGIQDFWRRWHISLSTWFREYLYIPLGGNRKGKLKTYRNLYLVFLATGIWHGANWTFLVWGLYHGTFLVLERIGAIPVKKIKLRLPVRIYTLLVIIIGFVIFRADTLGQAAAVVLAMFGGGAFGGAGYAASVRFLSPYYLLLFAAAALGATPVPQNALNALKERLAEKPLIQKGLETGIMLGSLLLLALCFLQLASDSYNPFIYFRF